MDELTTPTGGVSVQKPRSNVYTVMLVLALLAIIIGCVFLYLEIQEYGGDIYGPAASLSTGLSTAIATGSSMTFSQAT